MEGIASASFLIRKNEMGFTWVPDNFPLSLKIWSRLSSVKELARDTFSHTRMLLDEARNDSASFSCQLFPGPTETSPQHASNL
jgi:hypothetical protein